MIVVSLTTEKYLKYLHPFYNSLRLQNNHKVVMFLVNVSSEKTAYLKTEFPDIDFKTYTGTFNKWRGLDCVVELKPKLVKKVIMEYDDDVVWVDMSKLILGDLNLFQPTDKMKAVYRGHDDPNTRYLSGLFSIPKNRIDIVDRMIKICDGGRGEWWIDQKSISFIPDEDKEHIPYKEVMSTDYTEALMVRNMPLDGQDKNLVAIKEFLKIMNKKIEGYEETYKNHINNMPKRIAVFIPAGGTNWCFSTTVEQISKHLTCEIKVFIGDEILNIEEYNPDIIWCRGGAYTMPERIVKDYGDRIFGTISTGGELLDDRIKKSIKYPLRGYFVQNKDGEIRLKNELKKLGRTAEIYLVHNGVDLDMFSPKPKPKEFIIGFAGRTSKDSEAHEKGFNLVKQVSEITGIPLRKVTNEYPDRIPHEKMPDFFNSISVLILPTNADGHSNTILEAQACGLPVITTKLAFHGETATDNENLLFCTREVYDIIQKLELLKDKKFYNKISNGARKYATEYPVSKVANILNEIF